MSNSIEINRHVADQGVLTINGRKYQVELVIAAEDSAATRLGNQCRYLLHGARGAVYSTFRKIADPTVMFLINDRGKVTTHALNNVLLSDRNGELRVL